MLPASIDDTQKLLASADYVADRSLATALYLSLAMQRPLFLEGEAGVGKTEIGRVLAKTLERPLIRQVLLLTRWNQVRTAEILGINRNTLRTRMGALGIRKAGDG